MSSADSKQIERVVVRAPNWLGDAVISIAALRELRRLLPNSHITVVSKPGTADVFARIDDIDDVIVYERKGLNSVFDQVREWKRHRFDLALLFQNAFEAATIAFMARVPLRVGYATERRGFLLTHSVSIPEWKNERHEIFYYLNLVAELERRLFETATVETETPHFGISVSDDQKRDARTLLRERGVEVAKSLVLLCPGSVNSRAKRWPAERYAALADRLAGEGSTVALIGAPSELDVSRQVAAFAKQTPLVLTGQTSVAELISIISVGDLLITNDTGPAHVGAAVGTPTLVVFGPTNPLTTKPFGPDAKIIRSPPVCAPCMLRDCPIDHRCMTAIGPDEVFERAQRLVRPRLEVAV